MAAGERAQGRAQDAMLSSPALAQPHWGRRCHHHRHGGRARRSALRRTAPQQAPQQQLEPGFACLPGVTSPSLLRAYWQRACRPRLDKLSRTASQLPPKSQLLPVVDQLLHELQQVGS